jgi:serine/threonine protein kinase
MLAGMLLNENIYHEAEENLRQRIRSRDAFLGKDDKITLGLKLELGQLLLNQNRHQEAGSIFQEVEDVRERAVAKDHDVRERAVAKDHEDKAARNQLELQTKLSELQEAEENLRQKIRGRDAFLGKDDKITLGLKLKLRQLLLEKNRHQEAGSVFQEVEHDRERTLGKQSPAHSESLARSLPLVQSPPGSLPQVPLVNGTTAKSQEMQSPPGPLPLVHDTKAMSRDRLNTFFLAPTESRQSYDDSEIFQISTLLRQTNFAWSRLPRTYIILRTIDCLHHLDELIDLEFSDYLLPVNQRSVPDCLSPKMRRLFLDSQKLILTRSMDLEKGAKGHHCHFEKGESLPFESKGVIGSGGFGQVDRILSQISFKEYARKRVPRKLAFGRLGVGALKGMIGEIEAMKKLKHHHIVEFVGSYTDPKYLSVIMYPVAEQDLCRYLEKAGSANHAEMRTFFGCLTTGLQFLHDRQIRHKDIKPGNILVDKGQIYFTDFGLALDFEDATGSTTVGMVNFATSRYCAPEVALWEPRNTSSDIWSLGVIFLEMIVVLKGRTIKWMDDFLGAHGSYQTFVRSNPTGLEELLAELKQTVNLSDNVALVWIQQILQEQHKLRPTAARLATSITQPYSHGGPDTTFCGICCLAPDDTHSDTSDDIEAENFLRDFALPTRVR